MRCVLVSKSLDLRGYLGPQFMRAADRIEIVSHPHDGPATDVRLAVAWHPPDDAFERYPNLQAVCSIGAGVDNILACPSLRPDVDVIRVVDAAQAQMMSGFVAWHVIGHQRRFATYQAQQREERWQRLGLRGAQDGPIGILGFGEIGRTVATDLGGLGFPARAWSRTPRPVRQGIHGCGSHTRRPAPTALHRPRTRLLSDTNGYSGTGLVACDCCRSSDRQPPRRIRHPGSAGPKTGGRALRPDSRRAPARQRARPKLSDALAEWPRICPEDCQSPGRPRGDPPADPGTAP